MTVMLSLGYAHTLYLRGCNDANISCLDHVLTLSCVLGDVNTHIGCDWF